MGIADKTVACAIEIAAAVVLAEYDRNLAALTAAETALAMWGGKKSKPQSKRQSKPNPEWETVEEF